MKKVVRKHKLKIKSNYYKNRIILFVNNFIYLKEKKYIHLSFFYSKIAKEKKTCPWFSLLFVSPFSRLLNVIITCVRLYTEREGGRQKKRIEKKFN